MVMKGAWITHISIPAAIEPDLPSIWWEIFDCQATKTFPGSKAPATGEGG